MRRLESSLRLHEGTFLFELKKALSGVRSTSGKDEILLYNGGETMS